MALAGTGVTLAVLPTMLSTPLGLHALLGLLNANLPQGRVHAARLDVRFMGPKALHASLEGLELYAVPDPGGRQLASAQCVLCVGTPWQMLTGKPSRVTVTGAHLDGGYSPSQKEFHLVEWLQRAGLLEPPPPGPSRDAGPNDSNPHVQHALAESEPVAEAQSSSESAFMRALSSGGSAVQLSAEVRLPGMQLWVEGSRLEVSADMKDILGDGLHVRGAFGGPQLMWLQAQDSGAGLLPVGRAWWESAPSHSEPQARLAAVVGEHGEGCCQPGEWQVTAPNLEARLRVWEVALPLGWSHALGMGAARGAPRKPSFSLLHEPATLAVRFTPALGSVGLATANPLLGRVTALSEGSQGSIRATMVPDGWALPYTRADVWVEPMCLRLSASPVLAQLMEGMRAAGLKLGKNTAWVQQAVAEEHGQAAGILPGTNGAALVEPQPPSAGLLEAWVSGQRVTFERDGAIEQHRVDMLIGPPGLREAVERGGFHASRALRSALHLALWGDAHPDTDRLDMVVGLPEDLLARLGATRLPPGYCLPLPLQGTLDAPALHLSTLRPRVLQLLMLRAADAAAGGGGDDGQQGAERDGEKGEVQGLAKAWRATKHIARLALAVLAPSGARLRDLEVQLERDAAAVPYQSCAVPWLPAAAA